MDDQQRQLALKRLEEFRANLDGNPYGFDHPDYATAPAEPAGKRAGCYVYRLTLAVNGYTGFVLADAIYPIADSADLARVMGIIKAWRWVQAGGYGRGKEAAA